MYQLVWNASATCAQGSCFAHRARNHAYAVVTVRLPSAHGTRSTLIPHVGHCTRRIAYTKYTRIPQNGMNSNRRAANRSYPGHRRPQPEQSGRLFLRGASVMFNTNCSFSSVNSICVYTNPWCF